jgi:fructose-1,6-bisphosphatase II
VDAAAVDAMRPVLRHGSDERRRGDRRGRKDEAPHANRERVGDGSGPEWDIAVDPVDGTTLTAKSLPDAVSIIGVSPRGTMFSPGPAVYMQKLVVPGDAASDVDLDAPIATNLAKIAATTDRAVSDLTVCVLDRPRHAELVTAIRAAGARIRFLLDGDVAGAIMAVTPSTGVDLLVGVGGTPEGVLAACALRCLGGEMFGRLIARNESERSAILDAGYDLDRTLTTTDLVSGDNVFFAPPALPMAHCCAACDLRATAS